MNDPEAHVTSYLYDSHGRILAKTVDGTTTTYQYDELDRLVEERTGDVLIEHYYNTNGQEYRVETRRLDGTVIDSIERKFDEAGEVIHLRTGDGEETFYEFDDLDRTMQVREVSPIVAGQPPVADRITTYEYNADGSLRNFTTATGTTEYGYDALGRQILVPARVLGLRRVGA